MQVLFVTDFSLRHSTGGSQRNTSILLKEGRNRGHDVVEHNYDSSLINTIRNWDVVISSNLECFAQKNQSIFPFLINHPCHIRSERDSCSYLQSQMRQLLFSSTKANIFLSDYHLQFFQTLYGDIFKRNKKVYSPIDTDTFRDIGATKEYDVVYCGYLHPLKGLQNLIDFAGENPDRKITVFGWGSPKDEDSLRTIKNIDFKGAVEYEEVHNIFQRTKNIFHSPIVREPFCRMVAEAIFCGAELIGSPEKIGVALEIQQLGLDAVKEASRDAPKHFWDNIETTYETDHT